MSLKTFLPTLFFCTLGIISNVLAQDTNSATPRITIKSFTQDGDSTKEATSIINFQDRNQVIVFLDSILGGFNKPLQKVQEQLGQLGLSDEDMKSLDSVFNQLSNKFRHPNKTFKSSSNKVILGVMIDDYNNTNDLSLLHPVISSIIPRSPAEHAGLRKNDILFKLDDEEVNLLPDIINIIKNKSEGDSLHIVYIRDADTLQTLAILRAAPQEENWLTLLQNKLNLADSCDLAKNNPFCEKIIVQKSRPRLGVKVIDLNDEARKDLKAKKTGGAVITQVLHNSTAEEMNLKVNDVIFSINGKMVTNISELKNIVDNLPIPQEIEIRYIRYGKKKKAKGTILEFSKAWDDNELMNIIDLSNFFKE